MTMLKPPVRIVALIILIANILPLVTLGEGILFAIFLYGAAGLVLGILTKRGDVRLCLALSVLSFLTCFSLGDRLAPLVIFGGVLLWIEALRRQASETEGSRAAVHYRSIQGFLTIMLVLAVAIFTSTDAETEAWVASIEIALGLSVGIYLILASYCWFAELKTGAVLTDDSSDKISL